MIHAPAGHPSYSSMGPTRRRGTLPYSARYFLRFTSVGARQRSTGPLAPLLALAEVEKPPYKHIVPLNKASHNYLASLKLYEPCCRHQALLFLKRDVLSSGEISRLVAVTAWLSIVRGVPCGSM